MIQSYQDLSKYFPRLNIDKLKTIAQRWVDNNANIPINRIVLYTYSSRLYQKRRKEFIETEYAVVFEILKKYEYKKYGMTFQELHDYHEATDRGEIITPDPMDEFLDREENTPDPMDEFIYDTECHETAKPENPFLSFMTKDFENVYWETPKSNFKDEWDLRPRWLVKKGVFMELSANVRTREPHEILFPVQTEETKRKVAPSKDSVHIPIKVVELINEARPEIEFIYDAIKEGVGFNKLGGKYNDARMEDALEYFREYKNQFTIIIETDLNHNDTYDITSSQHTRKIKGSLLKTIIERRGFGRYSSARLFKEYQKNK